MSNARGAERLRAVAESFLRPRAAPARNIVIASAGQGLSCNWIGRALLDAADRLGGGAELWLDDDAIVRRPGAEGGVQLRIVVFGHLEPDSVRRLEAPPATSGPELLLYALRPDVPTLRESYTLALWAWALGAQRVRGLLPALDRAALAEIRARWPGQTLLPRLELLAWPSAERAGAQLAQQILHSVLAAGPPREQPKGSAAPG